ncbi:hypothetical protein AAFF_G00367450 [Aldrovandia affinis]|uniref:Uncharacterized protein n=1 Tax=Aldrovandia affinis TaxID=143900 RepID=A0AAD7SHK3_9TELE|nr:hypothetical protein AAFF_G00367450 [Aldrovandia affinis]
MHRLPVLGQACIGLLFLQSGDTGTEQTLLLHQLLHALVGLVILVGLEDQLLQAAFVFTQDLHSLHVTLLLTVQL